MSWLVDTLLVTGALIAAALVLRRPVSRLFGPGIAYALWALPMLRLLVPPLTLPAAPVVTSSTAVTVLTGSGPDIAATAPAWSIVAPLLQTVWLVGALAYLGWRVWQYRVMRRNLLAEAVTVGEAQGVRLIESPSALTPVAFGIRDRVIALPPGFMTLTPRQNRDLAIAHELEHHKGRDLAINIAMQPLLALHWFNPLAWLGWRALRRDQEAACDARVLAGRAPDTREAYGRLIASFAAKQSPALASPLACPILHEKSIVHRLRSLTMTQPSQSRCLTGRLLLGAAALALPLTATISHAGNEPAPPTAQSPPAATETVEVRKVHKIVIVDVPEGTSPDAKDLHVRTVERNGKTIVLKTKTPLTDAEAEERIAKAEASMPPLPPEPPVPPHSPGGTPQVSRHIMIVRHDGTGSDHAITMHSEGMAMADCAGGNPVTAVAENAAGDKETKRVMVFCAKGGDKTAVLSGMRKARDSVAADPSIPDDAKAEALKQLDAEIEKLSKVG